VVAKALPAAAFHGSAGLFDVRHLVDAGARAARSCPMRIFKQNVRLSAAYRLDAYFGTLKVPDPQGNLVKIDRYFHGPRVTAAINF
jgi:hypothetical protein